MPKHRSHVLSIREKAVVDNYLANGLVKSQALRAAGYSDKTAEGNPQEIFNRPSIAAEIKRRQVALAAKYQLTTEWIIERLMRIADGGATLAKFRKVNPRGELYYDFTGATEVELSIITDMTIDVYMDGRDDNARPVKKLKISASDPKGALDSLARHLGMFNDKVTVSGEMTLIERLQRGRDRARANQEKPT